MSVALRRAAKIAFACLFALVASPHFASAQYSDYPASSDYSDDDAQAALTEIFDSAVPPWEATAEDATPGIPEQAVDFALGKSPTLAIGPTAGVPARFVAVDNHFDVRADGSSTTTTHIEVQLVSPQAVALLAQPALTYSDSLQTLEIKNAYTLKPDGTKLAVAPDAILVRQKAMPSGMYSDLKEKVILFPNVEPGDTLAYDSVMQTQARIRGQFNFGVAIPRALEVDEETISFTVPKTFPLTFDSYGLVVQKIAEGDNLVYTIRYANRMPALELPQFLSDFDHGLRVFVSSGASFDAMAAGYAPLVTSKIAVTPSILAKANDITAGIIDRREQARKLYDWVSGHVRYIALAFGDGGVVPHAADAILTNAYGDCKDHAVLYSALLKAKGISSEPVLINAANGYFLPQVPQLMTFNHMIVWLPDFGLYADTTSGTTPFGALPPFEYGKPVVRIGDVQALQHTPILAEGGSTYSSSSLVRLESSGRLSGTTTASATGALSGVLRAVADQTAAAGPSSLVGAVLRARKMDSAAGSVTFAPTAELTPQFSYSSNYQFGRAIQSDIPFAPPEGLNLVDAYSVAFLGPVADGRYLASDSLPCLSGTLVDDTAIQFPADKVLVSVPQDGQVQAAGIDYRSHWSLAGNTLSVHRELHAHFDKALCSGVTLAQTRAAIIRIQRDYGTRIAFATAHAS